MSRWPLLLDEDSSDRQLERALAEAGWDVTSVRTLGWERLSDGEVLERATAMKRVVVTANRNDYRRLDAEWHSSGRLHAGIILRYPQQVGWNRQMQAIERILNDHPGPLDGLVLWARAQ